MHKLFLIPFLCSQILGTSLSSSKTGTDFKELALSEMSHETISLSFVYSGNTPFSVVSNNDTAEEFLLNLGEVGHYKLVFKRLALSKMTRFSFLNYADNEVAYIKFLDNFTYNSHQVGDDIIYESPQFIESSFDLSSSFKETYRFKRGALKYASDFPINLKELISFSYEGLDELKFMGGNLILSAPEFAFKSYYNSALHQYVIPLRMQKESINDYYFTLSNYSVELPSLNQRDFKGRIYGSLELFNVGFQRVKLILDLELNFNHLDYSHHCYLSTFCVKGGFLK